LMARIARCLHQEVELEWCGGAIRRIGALG
jgi:hypothetical protein